MFHDALGAELDTSPATDPEIILKAVVGTLSDDECRDTLLGPVGRAAVVDAMRMRARHALSSRPVSEEPAPAGAPKSGKWANAQRSIESTLHERVYVPGRGHVWLSDCTRADLLAMAEQRHELARQNTHAAERFEALAALLPVSKPDRTLGEVPPHKIAEVLG